MATLIKDYAMTRTVLTVILVAMTGCSQMSTPMVPFSMQDSPLVTTFNVIEDPLPDPGVEPPVIPGISVFWDVKPQDTVLAVEMAAPLSGISLPAGWTAVAMSELGSFVLAVTDPSTALNADGSIMAGTQVLRWPIEEAVIALMMQVDPPSGDIVYIIETLPVNGTLKVGAVPITIVPFQLADNSVIYDPNTGFSGADSFTYKVNDGFVDSNIATVDVTVNAINHPPVAANVSISVDEDSAGNVVIMAGSDPDAAP